MATAHSFDVVSDVDMQEVDNAINQALKEIKQRYDFKNTITEIKLGKEDIKIISDDDFKLKSVIEVLVAKLIKRGISGKALDLDKKEEATLGSARQTAKIIKGISTEKAKKIIAEIKSSKIKVQAQIMDNQLRISGKNLDDLQEVMALIKSKDFDIALQFTNFR
ncbi:YajQ family cyclic di-GMP-binding protein [Clostridium estertheticum]|uniref:YajQ family cyclic di-GMP-binding protein n=1 Tax=Clostridium estertheticum TaxID=238834 RepID=UPI001C6DDEC9|nr:YajQ family cyclic di-GMP-binding protein [Clostridium estertheticum]MBW9151119.1 YajQ family cyclic di-GMP-binding protein [Clostridium estertheticum]WLC84884.1 YajQ family cyclic di-GMP-binding protein [Clostridium estertheticum]